MAERQLLPAHPHRGSCPEPWRSRLPPQNRRALASTGRPAAGQTLPNTPQKEGRKTTSLTKWASSKIDCNTHTHVVLSSLDKQSQAGTCAAAGSPQLGPDVSILADVHRVHLQINWVLLGLECAQQPSDRVVLGAPLEHSASAQVINGAVQGHFC